MRYITFCLLVSATLMQAVVAAPTRPYVSHAAALNGIGACVAMAQQNGWAMSIVVIDRGEDVVASARMDGALPASYKGATLKAQTALSWGMPTGEVNNVLDKFPVYKQFPGIMGIGGGAPVVSGDTLIGSVGVAGHAMPNDVKCAQAAVDAMQMH